MLAIYTALLALTHGAKEDTSEWIGHSDFSDKVGDWVSCDEGAWVRGFRVKTEGFDSKHPAAGVGKKNRRGHPIKYFGKEYPIGKHWCDRANCADNTALQAINVLCSNEDPRDKLVEENRDDKSRVSVPGSSGVGKWSNWYLCDDNEFVTGIRAYSEKGQGEGLSGPQCKVSQGHCVWWFWDMNHEKIKNMNDDTAMNNIAMRCTNILTKKSTWKLPEIRPPVENRIPCTGADFPKGKCIKYADGSKGFFDGFMGWSDKDVQEWTCKDDNAMKAFKVRSESDQGGRSKDDSGLNQIKVWCNEKPKCAYVELSDVQGNTKIKRDASGKKLKDKKGQFVVVKDEPKDQNAVKFNGDKRETVTGWTVKRNAKNCDGNLPQSQSIKVEAGRKDKIWDTVSFSESLSSTFSTSMEKSVTVGTSVGISLKVGDVVKVGGSTKVTGSHSHGRTFESTSSKDETKARQTREAKGHSFGMRWNKDVPAYSSMLMTAEFYKYEGFVRYTATATCWTSKPKQPKDKKVPRIKLDVKVVEGVWETQGFSRGKLITKDTTDAACPKPECKCEPVYSKTLKDGRKCIHTGAKGTDTANRWAKNNKEPTNYFKKGHDVKAWCYVRKGACRGDMSGRLNSVTDEGLESDREPMPTKFEWSSEPCAYIKPEDWKKATRRLDFEETGGLNAEFVGPQIDDALLAPAQEEEIEFDDPVARRLSGPTPAPTTYLQKIPGMWPRYAMEECSCDTPNTGVGSPHNKITCLYSEHECKADETCFVAGKTVWARTRANPKDNWRKLCKKA